MLSHAMSPIENPTAVKLSWKAIGVPLLVLAAALVVWVFANSAQLHVANIGLLTGIAAMALTVLMGQAGLLSLGHGAFLAIGAFAAGLRATKAGFGFVPTVIVAGVLGLAFGGLIAVATLRTFGLYLSVSTFALQYVVDLALTDVEVVFTRAVGFTMPTAELFGMEISTGRRWWIVNLIIASVVYVILRWVTRSHVGRGWIAVRTNATVAAGLGISAVRARTSAFMLTSMIAAVAGALHAYFVGIVQIASFPFQLSIMYVTIVVLGSLGSLGGAIVASYVVVLLPQILEFAVRSLGIGGGAGVPGLDSMALAAILVIALLRAPQRVWNLVTDRHRHAK